eukprot:scaffold79792_cov10-Tisochrysis_lutea.AAC.1
MNFYPYDDSHLWCLVVGDLDKAIEIYMRQASRLVCKTSMETTDAKRAYSSNKGFRDTEQLGQGSQTALQWATAR